MITLNTNLSSLIVQSNLQKSTNALNIAIERMTSGYKINGAKDNAANYSIVTDMSTKLGAYQVAEDNVAMGLDLLSTASENLDLIGDKLSRLRALAEQSANGTYGTQSRKAINAEANALVDEIERLYNTTSYNGIDLYRGDQTNNHTATIPDDAQRVSEVSSFTAGKTYTLSSKEDLIKLQDLVNISNKDTTNVTFIMTNDIDMSGVNDFCGIGYDYTHSFKGTFDGNDYAVKNLTINKPSKRDVGLFGYAYGATIRNLGVENCDINGYGNCAGLVGDASSSNIINCYSYGTIQGEDYVGGLVGEAYNSAITSCHSFGTVNGSSDSGGLVGEAWNSSVIQNCSFSGTVNCFDNIGGLVGYTNNSTITNCYSTGTVNGWDTVGGLVGDGSNSTITNNYTACNVISNTYGGSLVGYAYASSGKTTTIKNNVSLSTLGLDSIGYQDNRGGTFVISNNGQLTVDKMLDEATMSPYINNGAATPWKFYDGYMPMMKDLAPELNIGLQVGINSDSYSQIDVTTGANLGDFGILRNIGNGDDSALLPLIDKIINNVSAKQTHYGASQNRLESALEEISTQYENLVSSRSTLRDADIGKVSSEYIRQQILQQASATLLATANQSPALALQLL